jgi:malate dehydrogenase (oxaloacetate-decarboxylating)/malate dehydrogenase (oxaloacetate-decarboxylating)(NADP+)
MPTPLLQCLYLSTDREKNEAAFWRFLYTCPAELTIPVLYTPTVGEGCTKWSTHRPTYHGIYITAAELDVGTSRAKIINVNKL